MKQHNIKRLVIPGEAGLPNNVECWTMDGFIYCITDYVLHESDRWHIEKILGVDLVSGHRGRMQIEFDRFGKYLLHWSFF